VSCRNECIFVLNGFDHAGLLVWSFLVLGCLRQQSVAQTMICADGFRSADVRHNLWALPPVGGRLILSPSGADQIWSFGTPLPRNARFAPASAFRWTASRRL